MSSVALENIAYLNEETWKLLHSPETELQGFAENCDDTVCPMKGETAMKTFLCQA